MAHATSCPYVGLQPYTEDDRQFFFGREREQRIISSNLYASSLTVVYGASGVGKSSILRAGVVPYLESAESTTVVYFNQWQDPSFVDRLKSDCLSAVAKSISGPLSVDTSQPLHKFLAALGKQSSSALLILLDQFEEYFLYHPESDGAQNFDGEFASAVNQGQAELGFMISLRDDWLSRLDRFQRRIPNLLGNTYRLEHLTAAAAEQAIRKPLEVYNAASDNGGPVLLEDELVHEVLAQVRAGELNLSESQGTGQAKGTENADRIETAFLQLVMTRLWDQEMAAGSGRLRVSTLRQLGGAKQIVQSHLDNVLNHLPVPQQEMCASMFRYLVTPKGAKIAHETPDLVAFAEHPADEVKPLLEKLADPGTHLLRRMDRPERYEIFHDVLGPAILAWRTKYKTAQEVAIADERADEQRLRAEKEARAATRLRWLSISFAILVFLAGVTTFLAWNQRTKAREQELEAAAISNLQQDPQLSLWLALQAASTHKPLSGQSSDALSQAVQASRQIRVFHRDNSHAQMLDASFSPDGTRLATAANDGTSAVWEVSSGKKIFPLQPHKRDVFAVIFSPRGKYIATSSYDGTTNLYTSSGVFLKAATEKDGVLPLHIAFNPDDTRLIIAKSDSTMDFWDLSGGTIRKEKTIALHEMPSEFVESMVFSPDGKLLATCLGHMAMIWDIHAKKMLRLQAHTGEIYSVVFSPDANKLATGSTDGTAKIWDAHSGQLLADLKGHTNTVFQIAFDHSDGSRVATASADGTARIWDVRTSRLLFVLSGHKNALSRIAFSPDGRQVVTASWDGTAILWDASSFHSGPVMSLAFSRGRLASAGQDGIARVWNAASSPLRGLAVVSEKAEDLMSIAFSPNGERLATSGVNGWAKVFDSSSGKELFSLKGLKEDVNSIAFSPDGERLITAHADGTAKVWNASGDPLFPLEGHTAEVSSAIFSPDGKLLATASADRTVKLWDASSGKPLPGNKELQDQVLSVAFSPDSKFLAASAMDGTVRVFDLTTNKDFELSGHSMAVPTIAFDLAGKRLATASWDRTVRVWDLISHHEMFVFTHPAGVESVAFSSDGKYLATGCDDGMVRLYPLDDDELLKLARSRVARTLTSEECRQYLHTNHCPVAP